MAVTRVASPPLWPEHPIDAARCRILFGMAADELVVRFPNLPSGGVSSPIDGPDNDFVAVLVDDSSGAVVGIHVYPLLAGAARHHPAWRRLTEPDPPAALVARFVEEVRELFERHWTPAPPIAEQLVRFAGRHQDGTSGSD